MISIILVLLLLLITDVLPNALNILSISGIIIVLSYMYKNMFNKAHWYYILAVIVASLSLYFYEYTYFRLVNRGLIGYGFIFIVMFVGVLPNKWDLTRVLKKNRGVYSILGFIMISPHAIGHVFKLFWGINLFGIAAYAIMVPLTIISFRVIRNEINPKDWFTIQKGAYIVYIVLFAHLIMVAAWENKIVYAVLLTLYINNKVLKEIKRK